MQNNKRFTAGLPPDFDVFPAELAGKAGSERLGHSFLCRKTNRKMRGRIFHPTAILGLCRLVDLLDKPVSVPSNSIRNPAVFHHVDPNTKDHPQFLRRSSIWRTAFSRPTKSAREMIECPMLNSFQCGILSSKRALP